MVGAVSGPAAEAGWGTAVHGCTQLDCKALLHAGVALVVGCHPA